jgi:hypothetical protein
MLPRAMNQILMRIVVDCAAFLELSDDSAVDPDAAVFQLEQIAAALCELTADERAKFTTFAKDHAQRLETLEGKTERSELIGRLPQQFGLHDVP